MRLIDLLAEPPPNAIIRFLAEWDGDDDRPSPFQVRRGLPKPLAEMYAITRQRSQVIVQNSLIQADHLTLDAGRTVFYIENQGVYLWAFEPDREDPVVWGRYDEPGRSWQAEREPLSRFLLQVVLFEAVMRSDGAATSALPFDELMRALAPLGRLSLGAWRWPADPTWFYAGDDVLAIVGPSGQPHGGPSDRWDIFLAGRTPGALDYLEAAKSREWDSDLVTVEKLDS